MPRLKKKRRKGNNTIKGKGSPGWGIDGRAEMGGAEGPGNGEEQRRRPVCGKRSERAVWGTSPGNQVGKKGQEDDSEWPTGKLR